MSSDNPDQNLEDTVEEHIEIESVTGRFRRDAINAAKKRAAAEALANNRRDMRVPAGSFQATYIIGTDTKKFSLFGKNKKCTVIDASLSGMGIEGKKGLNKGDKITLTISDGKIGEVPEFEIQATVMYAGIIDEKKARYGIQYDQTPTSAYSTFLNGETLKRKMEKVREQQNDG